MNANDALGTIRTVLKLIGLAIACIAMLKLFGIQIPMRGSIIELAAVAIALAHA